HHASTVEEGVLSAVGGRGGAGDLPGAVDAPGGARRPAERPQVGDDVHRRAGRPRREEQRRDEHGPGELQLDEPGWHGCGPASSTTSEEGPESESPDYLPTVPCRPGASPRVK